MAIACLIQQHLTRNGVRPLPWEGHRRVPVLVGYVILSRSVNHSRLPSALIKLFLHGGFCELCLY